MYYDDGTTHDDSAGIIAAPGAGVIVVVQDDNDPGDIYAVGRELLFDADYYCWREEEQRWFRCDLRGLFDYLLTSGWKKVLAGRTAPRSVYRAVLQRAQNDPDFSIKSASQRGEERLAELSQ